ncbi:MAG TPA: hypothetical protein VHZ54_09980 [Solirubrobacterales bacterium]|jgi:hypothetical protein|nr:hypothetical protein [Solirubrobacterales bacterium]
MRATAPAPTRARSALRRANSVAAGAFLVGGSLFAIGAALAQADIGGPRLAAVVYLIGGVFFSTGGYASVLLAINAPHRRRDGAWARGPWRWWAEHPGAFDHLAAVTLFVGTLVFGVNLLDSLLGQLTPTQEDRLVWNPDIIGCLLFLISGLMAMVDISGSWWRLRGEGLGWWIVFVNQVGSVLFMASGVASFVRADGDMIAVAIANWGTLTGALCFAIAGFMQFFEPPDD